MTSLLASSSETATDRILCVRFEDSCVLIPPPAAKSPLRPRIITKSYSLPLWKTSSSKRNLNAQSPTSPEASQAAHTEAEKRAFSLTVSVPSLTTKSRTRRSSIPPSSPCLSKRHAGFPHSPDSSTPPSSTVSCPSVTAPVVSSPTLHCVPSFPQIQPATLKQADTIPLRPCCEACHPCVDNALAQGENWSARWSRGAVRRYSEGEHVHLHAPHHPVFGVTRVWTPQTEGPGADGDMPLKDALTIDEVDVKRRSGDYSHAFLNNHHVPPPATEDAESDDEDVSQENATVAPLISLYHAAILKEEDENLLFPLPSPRRTPNHSPNLSPIGSQVNLATPPSASMTVPGPSGSQTNLSTPAVASPLASQDNKLTDPVARTSVPVRPPPPAPVTPTEPAPAPRSLSSSPVYRRQRSSSPGEARRGPARRSSFSTASGTFLRSSTSVLKGVAAGMMGGAGGGVGVLR